MRIVQINSVYGYGSTGKIVKQIHHELLKQHHESYVIYGRSGAFGDEKDITVEDNVVACCNEMETKLHLIKGLVFDKHGLYSVKNTRKIIDELKKINPDIIHLHNIHGFYVNYEMLFNYLKECGKQVVWTLHDCWGFTGFCSHYEFNGCDKWKTQCDKCNYRDIYPYRILSNCRANFELKKKLYTNFNNLTLVTPSNWLASQVKESMLKDKRVEVIHNDVNLKDFYNDNNMALPSFTDGKTILLGVSGIWNKRKGLDEFIKLARMLDDKYLIVLIGLSDKQLKNLPSIIYGLKRTESIDELRMWYSQSDYFINLTLEDTYPTVNLEAQACGLPVITYRTGGSTEMMGDNDYIVEKYDLDSICEIVKNKSKHEERVTVNHMIDKYIELYKGLL